MKRFLCGTLAVLTMQVALAATAPVVASAPASAVVAAPAAAHPASVPAGSWFVSGSKLYDPTGYQKYLAGVNNNHWDQTAARTGIPLTGANAVRLGPDFKQSQQTNWNVVDPYIAAGLFTTMSNWGGTCKSDVASLNAIVDTWILQASTWTKYNQTGAINIANEWGPGLNTSTPVPGKANLVTPNYTWRDSYSGAIQRMRLGGYNGLLIVDAGSCGQDAMQVARDGPAVLAADPLHNVLFDVHIYSSWYYPATASWMGDYAKNLTALKASGLAVVVGEFGPAPYVLTTITSTTGGVTTTTLLHDGQPSAAASSASAPDSSTVTTVTKSVGPSPTWVPTATLVQDVKDAGLVGWLAWSYNDNNLSNCTTSDYGWFGMVNSCSKYTGQDSELTAFGRALVPLLKATNGK